MNLTHSEKRLKRVLQLWMVVFIPSTIIFSFFGNILFSWINKLTEMLLLTPALLPIPPSQERFWLVLTTSLMVTLICLCYWAQKDIRKNLILVRFILISKFTSTLFFFIFFMFFEKLGAYLIGMAADGAVFLIIYLFYRPVKLSSGNPA